MLVALFFFMIYGICELSVVPIRAEAKDQSEIVSQLLLGDLVEILNIEENWTKVRCLFDDYLGWIDTKQITVLTSDLYEQIQSANKLHTKTHFTEVSLENTKTFAPFGSTFYKFHSSFERYSLKSEIESTKINTVQSAALSFLNAPYLWGGKTIYGIDCSGFTQVVFKVFGITLKRDAAQQVNQGESIDFESLRENDLAFFSNSKGHVIHVGIILNNSKIIHASGKIRIDELNSKGIYNTETSKLTHTLHSIRRYI